MHLEKLQLENQYTNNNLTKGHSTITKIVLAALKDKLINQGITNRDDILLQRNTRKYKTNFSSYCKRT